MITTTSRRGFTLIEVMIVSALIALLSGIAVFSIQEFYDSNVRKATIGEAKQITSALEFANQDLGFYPKLNYLREAKSVIQKDPNTDTENPQWVAEGLDYYGYLPGGLGSPALGRVLNTWTGPYYGASQNRTRSNRGSASGLTTMRLPEVIEALPAFPELSIVAWPSDPYGNPYVFYQIKYDDAGTYYPVIISSAGESANYFNAVVSYGPNNIPGGNKDTTPADKTGLESAALYLYYDAYAGTGGTAKFTLKTASPLVTDPTLKVETAVRLGNTSYEYFRNSLKWDISGLQPGEDPIKLGLVGIQDTGSDDIQIVF